MEAGPLKSGACCPTFGTFAASGVCAIAAVGMTANAAAAARIRRELTRLNMLGLRGRVPRKMKAMRGGGNSPFGQVRLDSEWGDCEAPFVLSAPVCTVILL